MSRTRRDHKGCSGYGYYYIGVHDNDLGYDVKPGCKPPSWWKKIRRRNRRAKERQALRNGKDAPQFKRVDVWDWN